MPTLLNRSLLRRELSHRPLVLFQHIPKAGGTSVVSYLHGRSVFFGYGEAVQCFAFDLHADIFGRPEQRPDKRCEPKLRSLAKSTARMAVAVEFHDYSLSFFWNAAARRARFEDVYARVITAIVVREPRGRILSDYHMWPPYTWNKPEPRVSVRLLTWLEGLATSSHDEGANLWHGRRSSSQLTQGNAIMGVGVMTRAPRNASCPSARDVRSRLASLDLVCETSRLSTFLLHLASLAGLPAALHAPHVKPGRSGSAWTKERVGQDLAAAPGNASVQRALAAVAACDERWFNLSNWSLCEPRRRIFDRYRKVAS